MILPVPSLLLWANDCQAQQEESDYDEPKRHHHLAYCRANWMLFMKVN